MSLRMRKALVYIYYILISQVVDAGVTDVNLLEQQDYDARTEYYA